jgi:hypothetical protein
MTKIYVFELFCNIGVPINEGLLKRLFLLSYGMMQSKTVNISMINDEISLSESGCKNENSQYNYFMKLFQIGDFNLRSYNKGLFQIHRIAFLWWRKRCKNPN